MVRNYVKVVPTQRICAFAKCGKTFETAIKQQRFCTKECRLDFIKCINEIGECPWCGKGLIISD